MVLLSVIPALYKVVFEKVFKRLVVGLVIGTSSRPVLLLPCARKRELRAESFLLRKA
jgi:hypothetical protein